MNMKSKNINVPFSSEDLASLRAGDQLLLSGIVLTARDEAHSRLSDLINSGRDLPVDLKGQVIYYSGPAPTKPGQIINSAGPTTAKRMDPYMENVLNLGVIGMIGKGERGKEAREQMKGRAVYMAALGGTSAKLAKSIVSQEIMAFEDLGMGAIRRLELVDFPVVVINDLEGNDYYEMSRKN